MTTTRPRRKIKQPHEVTYPNGHAINWRKPPRPNTMCSWTKKDQQGRSVKGSFRTLCHLNRINNLALHKYGKEIVIIQRDWNTGVAASAGTHDFDSVWDLFIPGVPWWEQQWFFRINGFGCWYRHLPLFGNHIHGFSLPEREGQSISDDFQVAGFKVGIYVDGGYSTRGHLVTSSQLLDYYNHAFGLSGQHTPGSDRSRFPKDIEATIFRLDNYVERRARLMAA